MFFARKDTDQSSSTPARTNTEGGSAPTSRESGETAAERQAEREASGPVAQALERTLSFRLVDDCGQPIAGKKGMLVLSDGQEIPFTSGSDGRYCVADLEPGTKYDIRFDLESFNTDEDPAEPDADADNDDEEEEETTTTGSAGQPQGGSSTPPPKEPAGKCADCNTLSDLAAAGTISQQCRKDSTDKQAVKALQSHLVGLGFDLGSSSSAPDGVDGFYGKKTESALKAFLSQNGRVSSGASLSADDARLLITKCPGPRNSTQPSTGESSGLPPQTVSAEAEDLIAWVNERNPGHPIKQQHLRDLMAYFCENKSQFANQTVVSVVDFSKHSMYPRWHFIDMKTGVIDSVHTSHGKQSDPAHTGYATQFSNVNESNKSSIGFCKTLATYSGKHGFSLRLEGLSPTNTNIHRRAIVVHSSEYIYDENRKQGRSLGCFMLSVAKRNSVINRIRGGSLMYAAN